MNIAKITVKLLNEIQLIVPAVKDISIGIIGDSSTVIVHPKNEQKNAQSVIDNFDWNQEVSIKTDRDKLINFILSDFAQKNPDIIQSLEIDINKAGLS